MSQNNRLPSSEIKTYVKRLYGEILLEMDSFLDKRESSSLREKQKLSSLKTNFIRSSSELKRKSFISPLNKRYSSTPGGLSSSQYSNQYSNKRKINNSYFSPYIWEKKIKDNVEDEKKPFSSLTDESFSSPSLPSQESLLENSQGFLENTDKNKTDTEIEDLMLSLSNEEKNIEESIATTNLDLLNKEEIIESQESLKSKEDEEDPFFLSLEETFSEEEPLLKEPLEKKENNLEEVVFSSEDKNIDNKEKLPESFQNKGMPFGLFHPSDYQSSLFWAGEIKWYLIKKEDKENFKNKLPKDYALCDGEIISQTQGRLSASPEKIEGTLPSWIEQYDEEHIVVAVVHLKKQEFSI